MTDTETAAPITSTDGARTSRWQRASLLRVALFGICAGFGIGLVALLVSLYSVRPKAWNTTAITATPVRAYVADEFTLAVQYRLRNNTNRDLRINLHGSNGAQPTQIFEQTFRGLTPLSSVGTRLEGRTVDPPQVFLPPGEDIGITIHALFLLHPSDTKAKIVEKVRRVKFSGFAIYDHHNRLRINLPFNESVIEAH